MEVQEKYFIGQEPPAIIETTSAETKQIANGIFHKTKELDNLYAERNRLEEEFHRRALVIIGKNIIDAVNDLKDEIRPNIKTLNKKIRSLEGELSEIAFVMEETIDAPEMLVEYLPASHVETSFPGTEYEPQIKDTPARVRIERSNGRKKHYLPAQMVMRLFEGQ